MNYLFKKLDIKIKTVASYHHQSLQVEHGIKSQNKRLKYMHKLLQDFKSKKLAMINKDRSFFQCNSRDLVYIISPLTSQLCTSSSKIMIKYIGLLIISKIIDPHNYLLMTLDGKILRGLFEHERLKPVNIRASQGNVYNLVQLRQIINTGPKV